MDFNIEQHFNQVDIKQYFGILDGDKINIFGKYEIAPLVFGTKFIINEKGDKLLNVNSKNGESVEYNIYKITK